MNIFGLLVSSIITGYIVLCVFLCHKVIKYFKSQEATPND